MQQIMSGRVGNLSPHQQECLVKFRAMVKDIEASWNHDDHYLLCWLRARGFDLNKSLHMYKTSMETRRKLGLDTLNQTWITPEVLQLYYPGGYVGYDKDGAPVYYDPLGRMDSKGLLHSAQRKDILMFKCYNAEHGLQLARENGKKLGKHLEQVMIVMDLEGLGVKHLWKPGVTMFNEIAAFYEANYPEMMKHILIIKAPKIFPIAYALVKPFLSEETRKKVRVLSGNWKEEMLEYIDAANLPEYYGGQLRDSNGDPKCVEQICFGGDVPESYYFSTNNFSTNEDMKTELVPRGSDFKVTLNISNEGSVVRWEFRSEDHDIGFGVLFSNSGKETDEIVPVKRCNSHMVPEQGSITCTKCGVYILQFDNSYSWTRSKKIFYTVEVLEPDSKAEDELKTVSDADINENDGR